MSVAARPEGDLAARQHDRAKGAGDGVAGRAGAASRTSTTSLPPLPRRSRRACRRPTTRSVVGSVAATVPSGRNVFRMTGVGRGEVREGGWRPRRRRR